MEKKAAKTVENQLNNREKLKVYISHEFILESMEVMSDFLETLLQEIDEREDLLSESLIEDLEEINSMFFMSKEAIKNYVNSKK